VDLRCSGTGGFPDKFYLVIGALELVVRLAFSSHG